MSECYYQSVDQYHPSMKNFTDSIYNQGGLNSSDDSNDESVEFKVTKFCLYLAILLFSVVGNSMVIYTICSNVAVRTSSNLLVLNLALCDLATTLTSIPSDIALEENNYEWMFGAAFCKILWPSQTFTVTSSALTLVVITADRYRAIVHPFKGHFWKNTVKRSILCIHGFSLAVVVPYSLVLKLDEAMKCSEYWPSPEITFRKSYTMVLFLSQYGLPLIFMTYMYSVALGTLLSSERQMNELVTGKANNSGTQGNRYVEQRPSVQLRRAQNIKITKMFVVIVVVFAISMFPNQILWLWVDYGNGMENENFNTAAVVCRIFTYANSVLNPGIYVYFSRDFRKGFVAILNCVCLRNRSLSNRQSQLTTAQPNRNFKSKSASVLKREEKHLLAETESSSGIKAMDKITVKEQLNGELINLKEDALICDETVLSGIGELLETNC